MKSLSNGGRKFLLLLSVSAFLIWATPAPSFSKSHSVLLFEDEEDIPQPEQFETPINPDDLLPLPFVPDPTPTPAPLDIPFYGYAASRSLRPLPAKYFAAEDVTEVEVPEVPSLKIRFTAFRQTGYALGAESIGIPASAPPDYAWTSAFAVNPQSLEFSSASFSKTAQGQVLYKCASWQFFERACPEGWQKIRDLAPGEEYSVPLSSSDPAWLEGNKSNAYNPAGVEFQNFTLNASGGLSDLASNNGQYLACRAYPSYFNASSFTRATIVYRSTSGSGAGYPHSKNWTNLALASEEELPDSGSLVRRVRVAYAPYPGPRPFEKIVVSSSDDGGLDAFVWNGTQWLIFNGFATLLAIDSAWRPFDVAYETNTSRAVVVYGVSSTNESRDLAYRVWDGVSWSAEAYVNDTSQSADLAVRWVSLASKPWQNSSEIALVYTDRTNADVQAFIWNGSAWTNETEITNVSSITTEESLAVAYESLSGAAMAVAGNGTAAGATSNVFWKRFNGASWSAVQWFDPNTAAATVPNWLSLKADPSSNRMMLTSVDAGSDLATVRYDGSGWTADARWDAGVDTNAQRPADFAWEPSGSKGLLVWGTATGSLSYRNFTAPSSWQAARTFSASSTHRWVQLRRNPRVVSGDVKMLGLFLNSTGSLGAFSWDGASISSLGDNAITQAVGITTNESFDVDFSYAGDALEYTAWLDFNGSSNLEPWTLLNWSVDSQFNLAPVNVTLQLYDYNAGGFASSGDGYLNFNYSAAGADETKSTAITSNPTNFRDSTSGAWKARLKAVAPNATELQCKIDWVEFNATTPGLLGVNNSAPFAGEYVKVYSFWTEFGGSLLSTFKMEWNASGSDQNLTPQFFPQLNNSWANYSAQVPGSAEGKLVSARIWASNLAGAWNVTANVTFTVQNQPPLVNSTSVNSTSTRALSRFCVNASAGDAASGVASVVSTVNYPNGTIFNVSLSDTGCNAGIAGDNRYGAEVLAGSTEGNVTINTTYATDNAGNVGVETPWPLLNVTIFDDNPYYNTTAGFFGVNDSEVNTSDEVEFFGFWYDDLQLSHYLLEWNGSGVFVNTTPAAFASSNASWGNVSAAIPQSSEGKIIWGRVWANDSLNQFNATPFSQVTAANQSPLVNSTSADPLSTVTNSLVCVNASAGDAGVGVSAVWVALTFPNGTAQNRSLADDGCSAGGLGDNWYGRSINVGETTGNFTVNFTYANDSLGNFGMQEVGINVTVTASLSDPPYYNITPGYFGVNDSSPLPGAWIEFYSFWYDDVQLSNYTLVWNISGTFVAQDYLDFVPDNESWGNYSIQVPLDKEGGVFAGGIRANDSEDQFNATLDTVFSVQNVSPQVNSTYANASGFLFAGQLFCVNASAGDAESGISQVWAAITYPNSTSINVTLSDTGCNAGGVGDNSYGTEVGAGTASGNVTVNTTYANDSAGNLAFESPFPSINLTVSYPPYYNTTDGFTGVNASTADTSEAIEFFGLWYDDLQLSHYLLEWNGSGVFVNTTPAVFASSNASWGNVSVVVPAGAEGQPIGGRIWANDSANAFNASANLTLTILNESPVVNSTSADPLSAPVASNICINASAGDAGVGVSKVWSAITYPNGTSINITLSDAGCNAGGSNDNWYGALANAGNTQGNLTVNYTYANDSLGNFGLQAVGINVTITDPFVHYNPENITLLNDTLNFSGGVTDLQSEDSNYYYCNAFESFHNASSFTRATIAYRSTSGNGATYPHSKNWTGLALAAEEELPDSASNLQQVRVAYAPYPGQRPFEKTVVSMGADGGLDAFVWNGTQWLAFNGFASVESTSVNYRPFDVAYEQNTSRALVVYGVGSSNESRDLGYRVWDGVSWSAEEYINDTSQWTDLAVRWVSLASKPWQNSSEIALVYTDGTNADVQAFIWDGSAWGSETQITAAVSIATEEAVGVAYSSLSGIAVAVAGEGSLVAWKNYTGSWSAAATFDPNTAATGAMNWLSLKADPSSDRMVLVSVDGTTDLSTVRYDGSSWTADARWDAGVDTNAQRPADFAWEPSSSKGLLVWGTAAGSLSYRNFTAPSSWQAARTFSASSTHPWVQLRRNPRVVSGDVKMLGLFLNSTGSLGAFSWDGASISSLGDNAITQAVGVTTLEAFGVDFSYAGDPLEYTAELEFNGTADLNLWHNLTWRTVSAFSVGGVNVTWRLYNYTAGAFPSSGPAYSNYNSSSSPLTDEENSSSILDSPADFRNESSTEWRLRLTAVKPGPNFFQCRVNLVQLDVNETFIGNPPYYNTTNGFYGVNVSQADTGERIEFFSYWYDDSGLARYRLEWNASGVFQNQSDLDFQQNNDTWGNYSIAVPASSEGKNVSGRVWARDAGFQYNATPLSSFTVLNQSPAVNSTAANVSGNVTAKTRFCVNASAGDAGVGVSQAWAMITYPNATVINASLSDTGCNAGGAGDNLWGAEVLAGATTGNITINTTYANDSLGNLGFESPWPAINLTVVNNPPQYNTTGGYLGANATLPQPPEYVKFYSFWSDDSGLEFYWLEWNATGVFENTTEQQFAEPNNSWANVTVQMPPESENETIWWRIWANGSINSTGFGQLAGGGSAPQVSNTNANTTNATINHLICVNATATDNGVIDKVWAMITFPNGTTQNWTMSDTGCLAGGAGDGWYGVQLNVSNVTGNLTVNTTYANDTKGNLGAQTPFPQINVTLKLPPNPMGGSGQYVGFFGTSTQQVRNQTAPSPAKIYEKRQAAGRIYLTQAGVAPTWSKVNPAAASDFPSMDSDLGLSYYDDLLENNYNFSGGLVCARQPARYMKTNDGNWNVTVLYSDEDDSSSYNSGDKIIFCADVNYNALDWNASRSDYEISFPKAYDDFVDFWMEG